MATWFDESRLDDEAALARADARAARRWPSPAPGYAARPSRPPRRARRGGRRAPRAGPAPRGDRRRPRLPAAARRARAVVPGAVRRLARARRCPAGPASLDLVVVLAPDGADAGTASAVAEAVRRGCQVVVACPPRLAGRRARRRAAGARSCPPSPATSSPPRCVMLEYLDRVDLGPRADAEQVAEALDDVAIACSPHRDLAVNPAKMLAIALADTNPLVWGGSVLAARAARRVAESIRRASGRTAIAGDAEHLLPVIEAARPRDVFDDPFADEPRRPAPDAAGPRRRRRGPVVREQRGRLQAAAAEHGVRVETVDADAATEVARYASLLLSGTYAAEYLRLGLVDD